ncbi:MAG: phosphodiester glycosidase family protein [Firmicutes bacterium]|nr:phosphodiester glycosidase family protein [Bacillota bacterium]
MDGRTRPSLGLLTRLPLAGLLLWLLASGPAGAGSVPGRPPAAGDPIGPGTSYQLLQLDGSGTAGRSSQPVHIVRVNTADPYARLAVFKGRGLALGLEPVLAQALAVHGPGRAVVAAVNGDFFLPSPRGLPLGLHLQNGEMITGPAGYPALGIGPGSQPIIGVPALEGRVWAETSRPEGSETSSWPIVSVNRPISGLGLVVYTPRFGPVTPPLEGTAVVVRGMTGPLQTGVVHSARVFALYQGSPTSPVSVPVPGDGAVLAARGFAEEFLEQLPTGGAVFLEVGLAPPFDEVTDAVGGRPVLVAGGRPVPLDPDDPLVRERHARTAVAVRGREVLLVAVDGPPEGGADGMTLWELQALLLELGAEDALNLDGGGSTTMVVRPVGETDPQVVNRPSDGPPRAVASALVVLSTAPAGELARLHVAPATALALAGSRMPVRALGQDAHYGPAPVPPDAVAWSADSDAASMEPGGWLLAQRLGPVRIEAAVGEVRGYGHIEVVDIDRVGNIVVVPDVAYLTTGEVLELQARAYTPSGQAVWVDPGQLSWSASGSAVQVDAGGRVRAVGPGEAAVEARLGRAAATVRISVDRAPELLSDFETPGQWIASTVRAYAELTLTEPGEPVRTGRRAARLAYDLRQGGGTAAAYAQAATPIPIPGRPRAIGVWVYGDGGGHWLRGHYLDGEGRRRVLNFTAVGGLDWTGWRFVEAPIDPGAPLPLRFERVYVVEIDRERQGPGVIYLDGLTALYGPEG